MNTNTTNVDPSEAATVILGWSSADVLCTITVGEASRIGDLFADLGRPDVREHIIREAWEGEDPTVRDPAPWVATDGTRISIDEPDAPAPTGYRFDARLDWEEDTPTA
ncbi:hypothetical protein LQK89_17975 (plasmid) [Curtobacterium sp. C1]|uniref:hypothetical protein n=1 Tax=Curtobacterium sp. C1 TaxID=2898151 RepID=UPI001E3D4BAC|nr:hypothetical protein [Curtobacterium sp. C1]UFU16112.1 hypothetical protein LQK89_17975 [Curtobacterium sp. C1]